jgi:RND family efflux transporter MFP subunit
MIMQNNIKVLMIFLMIFTAAKCTRESTVTAESSNNIEKKISVNTVKADSLKSKNFLELTGTLFADQDVTVMAAVTGNVAKINADEGDFVKKGEPLAILDQTEIKIGVDQAQHQLEAANLALKQTKIDFERAKNLYETKSIPENQFEMMKLKLDLSENQIKLATDGLNYAKKRLDDTYIRAPFDCYVTHRLVGIGSRITAMPPTVLYRIIDMNNLTFKMFIQEVDLKRVKEGDRVEISFDSISETVQGDIFKVIASIDPRSMSFTATVKMNNAKLNHILKPGLFGKAKIFSGTLKDTFIIEKKIVLAEKDGKVRIFIAEKGKSASRIIDVEEVDQLRYRVTAGLNDQDEIITSGISSLRDGMDISAAKQGN